MDSWRATRSPMRRMSSAKLGRFLEVEPVARVDAPQVAVGHQVACQFGVVISHLALKDAVAPTAEVSDPAVVLDVPQGEVVHRILLEIFVRRAREIDVVELLIHAARVGGEEGRVLEHYASHLVACRGDHPACVHGSLPTHGASPWPRRP